MRGSGPRLVALFLFLLSGASGLVFETVWQRMMVLVFGASAMATATILASLFLGLALGGYLGGRLLHRWKDACAFYACAELTIAAAGVAVPYFLRLSDVIQVGLVRHLDPSAPVLFALRMALAIAAVLPATLAMGATIPAMSRILSGTHRKVGASVALAYGMNTLGAVAGCLVAGFVLLRVLGAARSLWLAAAVDVVVAVLALAIRRRLAPEAPSPAPVAAEAPRPGRRALPALYFLTSFLALGYEIVWMRVLGLFTTNSASAFTLTLSIYLSGFAAGSLLAYPFFSRRMGAIGVFVLSSLGAGAASLLGCFLFRFIPELNHAHVTLPAAAGTLTLAQVVRVETVYAVAVMLLPTVFLGMAFPAVCHELVGDARQTDIGTGRLYFAGNCASAAGGLVVGLWWIPALGLIPALALLCVLSLLAGGATVFLLGTRPWRVWSRAGWIAGAALAAGAVAAAVLAPPPYRFGRLVRGDGHWRVVPPGDVRVPPGQRVLRQTDGRSATVTVLERDGEPGQPPVRAIHVDGQRVASTDSGAKVDSKMLAHLPLLLHPDPKRALTVGFGSGGTSWSMAQHGIQVDCVEIEAEVAGAAGYFDHLNHGVMGRDNFRLVLNDARNHLHVTDARYDVISTDCTNIQYKQNAYLYTREYFELMQARLTPDGVACAWVPMAAITADEFKTILASFAAVYPHATVWFINSRETNFAIFIGTPQRLAIDLERLRRGFADPGIRGDLAEIDVVHPYQFVNFLHLDEDAVRTYVGGAPLHTDDRPILEFTSPLSFYRKGSTFVLNLAETLRHRPASHAGYVRGPIEDRPLFDRFEENSRLRTLMILSLGITGLALPPAEMRGHLQTALACARASLALFPGVRDTIVMESYFRERLAAMGP